MICDQDTRPSNPFTIRDGTTPGTFTLQGPDGKFCEDTTAFGISRVRCNTTQPFTFTGNLTNGFKGNRAEKFCSDDSAGVTCDRGAVAGWERWTEVPVDGSGTPFPSKFIIKNNHHGTCLDSDNRGNNSNLYGWGCDKNNRKQQWTYDTNTQQIRNVESGMCVDISGGSTANGTRLSMYNCDPNNTHMKWVYNQNTRKFTSVKSGTCMDLGNGRNGQPVVGFNCSQGTPGHQEWSIEPV